jgi:hypothetical protein
MRALLITSWMELEVRKVLPAGPGLALVIVPFTQKAIMTHGETKPEPPPVLRRPPGRSARLHQAQGVRTMSTLAPWLIEGSAAIMMLLGLIHLLYTFHGPKLLPATAI